jgi:hypothetical protein
MCAGAYIDVKLCMQMYVGVFFLVCQSLFVRLAISYTLSRCSLSPLRQLLGSGAFGDVYRAEYLGVEMAAKKLKGVVNLDSIEKVSSSWRGCRAFSLVLSLFPCFSLDARALSLCECECECECVGDCLSESVFISLCLSVSDCFVVLLLLFSSSPCLTHALV